MKLRAFMGETFAPLLMQLPVRRSAPGGPLIPTRGMGSPLIGAPAVHTGR